MAKRDTTAAIKAANGTDLNPESYTGAQLEELLALAEKGEVGKAEFDQKLASYQPAATASAPSAEKKLVKPITVRVNDTMAEYGGEMTDTDSRSTIGKDPVTVETTPFVVGKLRTGELVEER